MELRIFAEPQEGASYEQQLAMARAAEQHGFGAFFRSDHLLRIKPGDPGPGPDRLLGDARRARARDEHDQARHDGHLGDVPAARAARGGGRPGRRR